MTGSTGILGQEPGFRLCVDEATFASLRAILKADKIDLHYSFLQFPASV